MKKINKIILVLMIVFAVACIIYFAFSDLLKVFLAKNNSYDTYNSRIDELVRFDVNNDLIEDFYRDDRLYPDNPDLKFTSIATFSIDLDNNHIADSIILSRLIGWENDPGDFHQITIITDSGAKFTETNFNGWVRFDNNYHVPDSIKGLNQIDTDFLLLTEFNYSKIVGLFGWVYSSDSGLLTIIDFSTRIPRLMINKNLNLIGIDHNRIITQNSKDKCWIECVDNKLLMTCE